jgi:methylglutaconyl-CoA hydratase
MSLVPEPVVLEVSPDGVAELLLNRPDKRNAFDELMIAQLTEAFETLKGADHVRVVFLRGAGSTFCAGADIDWMKRQGERPPEDNEADALDAARMFKALHDLPQLTVAMVQGAALGGGAGLVAACDVAVATANSKFGFSEVKLGLIPATIGPYIVEAIGPRWAKALFATGETFDAAFAEKIGLVQYAVEDAAALDAKGEYLAKLAFAAAPGAVTESKALVRTILDSVTHNRAGLGGHVIDEHLMKETAKRIAARRASPEGREGLAAFLEKRKPEWNK